MLKKHSAVKKNTHSEESIAEFVLGGWMGMYLKEKSHSMALHSKTHKLMFTDLWNIGISESLMLEGIGSASL